MPKIQDILSKIPHVDPYRFIDDILEVDECHIVGKFCLRPDSFFYRGHFPQNPLTPGFIISEIMAQIGILGLGLYLTRDYTTSIQYAVLTSADIKFYNVSYPNDTIQVRSRKIYFRFKKIKCEIEAFNQKGDLLCSGSMTGMIG